MLGMRVLNRIFFVCCVAVALVWLSGCSGGADFGESLSVPQDRHTKVDDVFGAGKTLRIPADVPFNVTDAQRFSSGQAEAKSSAEAGGKAECSAGAGPDGNAWAEFQLGHVLSHRGDKPYETTVTFSATYGYQMGGELSAGSATPDKFALKVYIMDSNRRVLKRMMLAELDLVKGPTTWTGTQSPAFDLTLEPGLAYHLVMAGRIEVSSDVERSPSAQIQVESLDIEIVPR